MKINEIIEESEITGTLQVIDKYCSNFVASMKAANSLLYRGIDRSNKLIFTAESPINRHPQGQETKDQIIMDTLLKAAGFKSLRSNSICCTPDVINTMGSSTYMIFPYNGYSFTWSEKINDIGGSVKLRQYLNMEDFSDIRKKSREFLIKFDFYDTDMEEALVSRNEITIHGTYVAIDIDYKDDVKRYYGIR